MRWDYKKYIYLREKDMWVKKNAKVKMEQVQKRRMEMLISRMFRGRSIERNNCKKTKDECMHCMHAYTFVLNYTDLVYASDNN